MSDIPQLPPDTKPSDTPSREKSQAAADILKEINATLPEDKKKTLSIGHKIDTKKALFIIGGVVLALVIVGIVVAMRRGGKDTPTPTASTPPTPAATATPVSATQASNLNGVYMPREFATRHPLAIMIENHPDARPQAGLGQANIVYEAITEGGITRFLTIWSPYDLPAKVGPVRSARQVFVDFSHEYGPRSAYYAHVGGSPLALEKLRTEGAYDLDHNKVGSAAYQRYPKAGVAIEHTMYAFPQKLFDVAKQYGYSTESEFTSWKFKDDEPTLNRPDAQTITIPFSGGSYEVKYVYDKESNSYKRFMAGSAHNDANTGKQITPKNVIVQYASYTPLPKDGKGTMLVGIVGEGRGTIYRDGRVINVTWKKPGNADRTLYYETESGKEVELNRGQIFVEIAPIGNNVTVQ